MYAYILIYYLDDQIHQSWELVDLPIGKKPVSCKLVFVVKFKGDGSLE